jgi:hypothetical protein
MDRQGNRNSLRSRKNYRDILIVEGAIHGKFVRDLFLGSTSLAPHESSPTCADALCNWCG